MGTRCDLQTNNKSFFSLPKIHKSWLSQPRHFIFTAQKREFVEGSVDYPERAESWITNKVCRKRSRQWEGLYSDFCTRTILPIVIQSPDNDETSPVFNNLNSNSNYPLWLSVPPQTSSPLFTYQPYTHLVSVRLRININIHLFICQGLQPDRIPPLIYCHPPPSEAVPTARWDMWHGPLRSPCFLCAEEHRG